MKEYFCLAIIVMLILSSNLIASAEEVKWSVYPQYDEIIGSDETGTIICVSKDGKYGYIDNTGKVLIDFVYDNADMFSEDLAYVERDGVKGFIDKTGKMILDTHSSKYFYDEEEDFYHTCERFSNGVAKLYVDNWNRIFIDKNGNVVDDYMYLNILDSTISSNIVTIDSQSGVTYYNLDTKIKLDGYYNNAISFSEGYGAVVKYNQDKEKRLLYILDEDFNVVAKDLEYNNFLKEFTKYNNSYVDENIGYKNGYLVVGNGYYGESEYIIKYGLIDTKGKEIIPLTYDKLSIYSDKLLAATVNDKTGYIDINNKWVIKAIYNKASDFKNGIAIVSEDFNNELWQGTFGIIDIKGEYIIKPTYNNIKFDKNSDLIYAQENGKWGILNIGASKSEESDNQPLPADEIDSWAKDEVKKAIEKKLVPKKLQSNYKENIKRGEFCDLVISLLEAKLNMPIDDIMNKKGLTYYENPFSDTKEINIIAANKLGIVNGKGNGKFDPNGYITRQEAAVMLANTAKIFGVYIISNAPSFADENIIASWAKSSVDYVSSIDVMKGTNKGFEPNTNYTRQQAYMTILRLFDKIIIKDDVINP